MFVFVATCSPTEFRCKNDRCVSSEFVCDLEDDCGDLSDEQGCRKFLQFTRVIFSTFRKIVSFIILIVTFNLRLATTDDATCDPSQFRCVGSGRCVRGLYRCDGRRDCLDGSDELACNTSGKLHIKLLHFS